MKIHTNFKNVPFCHFNLSNSFTQMFMGISGITFSNSIWSPDLSINSFRLLRPPNNNKVWVNLFSSLHSLGGLNRYINFLIVQISVYIWSYAKVTAIQVVHRVNRTAGGAVILCDFFDLSIYFNFVHTITQVFWNKTRV